MSIETEALQAIHNSFLAFKHRAEKSTNDILVETFVDSAPLLTILSNENNLIIYGRRGTGKTHALKFVAEKVGEKGAEAIYLDARSIGSNTSVYNDGSLPLSERASRLVRDVFDAISSQLYERATEKIGGSPDPAQITVRLDDFLEAIADVRVDGPMERTDEAASDKTAKRSYQGEGQYTGGVPSGKIAAAYETSIGQRQASSVKRSGNEISHINFGRIQSSLIGLLQVLGISKLWILIDEWSEIPIELQPYLADIIRRTILPIQNCVVKIAAIEHRSRFSIHHDKGAYTGLELAADISAGLNLDDTLVFDSDEQKSVEFFKQLLFRHYQHSGQAHQSITTADQLIHAAFTQHNVFGEFVRAVEGVPRDALHLAATIATRAFGKRITMQHVRDAARAWYQRDKANSLKESKLSILLEYIVKEVIAERRARAFLIHNASSFPEIDSLFDQRLLHILKRNISAKDMPGRFDVYKIDYGCYVELINTNAEPNKLFEADSGDGDGSVEVPKDDYRSIRRAVLDPEKLIKKLEEASQV